MKTKFSLKRIRNNKNKKIKKIAIKNKTLKENQTIDNTKDSLIENSH
jgi:hypothetical protein